MSNIKENDIEKIYQHIDNLRIIQKDMLRRFYQWVKDNDLKIFIAFGTYLGYVRENKIISWDNDVDTAMLEDDIDLLNNKLQFISNYGFESFDKENKQHFHPGDSHHSMEYKIYNKDAKNKFYECIDIFIFHTEDKRVFFRWWFTNKYTEKSNYSDLVWVDFLDTNVLAPIKYSECLLHQYNKDWVKPKKSKGFMNVSAEYSALISDRLESLGLSHLNIYKQNKKIDKLFNF